VLINTQFEVSKQFWAYLADREGFGSPRDFINPVPHLSFVRGSKNIDYLKRRFDALKTHHAFADMEYSEDRATLAEWMPLMMPGRDPSEPIAATRAMNGTDVNFGAVTSQLLGYLARSGGVKVSYNQKVTGLDRTASGWKVDIKNTRTGGSRQVQAGFVFLGAGGAALPLLQMSGIEEGKGFGGFPVSGQWLRCDNQEIVKQHQAKVYSLAAVGAPPMSVPHLDTRVVDGKKSLLFGPYAGFTTKFLKRGSFMDLPLSIRPSNIGPMMAVARDKKDPKKGGILQFGTELVAAKDGTIAALLGASPGASVTVSIMLDLLERCFPEQYRSQAWSSKLQEMFPAREATLQNDAAAYREISQMADKRLGLTY